MKFDRVELFDKETFYVDDVFNGVERARIETIITLLNGTIVDEFSSRTDYVITNKDVGKFDRKEQTKYVAAEWIYLMFYHKKLLDIDKYLL